MRKDDTDGKLDQLPSDHRPTPHNKLMLGRSDLPSTIKCPVLDPNAMVHFLKDLHDPAIRKIWGIFLDFDYCSLGIEALAMGVEADADVFGDRGVEHFYDLFNARRFMIVTNHTGVETAPSECDRKLIRKFGEIAGKLDADLVDYIIYSGDRCWSMITHDTPVCECGLQHYFLLDRSK